MTSSNCPTCAIFMDMIKDNTYYKCQICGYTVKIVKKIIKPLGVKHDKSRRTK